KGPLSGSEPGLEAYYQFDEGSGTIAHDLTANHRDATLATNGTYPASWIGPQSGQAIDTGGDGLTPNSPAAPPGLTQLQNFPIVVASAGSHYGGWLSGSLPNSPYHLEFFASASLAPDGAPEAEVYLGSLEVTTDGSGQAIFEIPYAPPADKPIVSAT